MKNCKTKEDVQRVRMNRTAASLSVVNNVKNNPAIPESAKLGVIWQELQKNMALEETIEKFVESGRYAKLPTEAEKAAAEKALKEAEDAELGIDDLTDNKEKGPAENETDADYAKEDIPPNIAKETAVHKAVQRSKAALKEHEMTRTEAEATPEAMKVKRARVQAAYKENQTELPNQIMDLKIE